MKKLYSNRLPDPCKEHALVMARFARDILEKLNNLTHKLEVSLGPDTGDLMMVRFYIGAGGYMLNNAMVNSY